MSIKLIFFLFSHKKNPPFSWVGCNHVLMKGRNLLIKRLVTGRLKLLENSSDIHTLVRQMGNSVLQLIIERRYSKLTAAMAAGHLA